MQYLASLTMPTVYFNSSFALYLVSNL